MITNVSKVTTSQMNVESFDDEIVDINENIEVNEPDETEIDEYPEEEPED